MIEKKVALILKSTIWSPQVEVIIFYCFYYIFANNLVSYLIFLFSWWLQYSKPVQVDDFHEII